MKINIKHNISRPLLQKVVIEELVDLVNFASTAISGSIDGSKGGTVTGIKSVLNRYKSTKGNPAPPGGPPGNLTGALLRSFGTRPAGKIRGKVVGKVGSDLDYGPIHEFGLNGVSRPFMGEGIDSAKPIISRRMRKIGLNVKLQIKRKRGPLR